jgi:predicted negative regulator of RcsB-dependent stress response
MKNVIIVLVLVAAGILGLGVLRGWFRFTSDGDANNANINLQVDKDKIHKDAEKAANKVENLAKDAKTSVAATTQRN